MSNVPIRDNDIEQAIREVLRSERSLKKNGESWGGWLGKILTPERILLLALLVYNLGQTTQEVSGVLDRQNEILAQHVELTTQVREARRTTEDTVVLVLEQSRTVAAIEDRMRTQLASKADLAAVRTRLQQVVTRREMLEALQQMRNSPRPSPP